MDDQLLPQTNTPFKSKGINYYAFNYYGIAYDHGVPDRAPFQRFWVDKISNKAWKDWTGETMRLMNIGELEDEPQNDSQTEVMWVGMSPKDPAQYMTTAAAAGSKAKTKKGRGKDYQESTGIGNNKGKGVAIADAADFMVVKTEAEAIIVVAVVGLNSLAKFYALVVGESNQVETRTVPVDHLFYFAEFRDNWVPSDQGRKSAWNALVRNATSIASAPKDETRFGKGHNATQIMVPWKLDLANRLESLAATYSVTNEKWLLQEMLRIIEFNREEELPEVRNTALTKMTSLKKNFSMEDARAAAIEIRQMWPEMTEEWDVPPDSIHAMASGLRIKAIVLPPRVLRPFIVEFRHRQLQEWNIDEIPDDYLVGLLCSEVADHVKMQVGGEPVTATLTPISVQANPMAALVESEIKFLTAVIEGIGVHSEQLMIQQGNQAVGRSLNAIHDTFAHRMDRDSALLWLSHSYRYGIAQMINRDSFLLEKCKDQKGVLEKFLQYLQRSSAGEDTG